MSKCPVCQTEYIEGQVKYCSICGWDLTPYPLTFELPDDLVLKEQTKLAWAREMWKRKQDETAVRQSEQEQFQQERTLREAAFIQLQSQVTEIQAKLQQVQQEQSELLIQLKESQSEREKSEQERILREAALIQLQSQVTEIQAKLQQVQQEQSELLIQHKESNQESSKLKPENQLRLQIRSDSSLEKFQFDFTSLDSFGRVADPYRRGSARQTIENLGNYVSLEMVYIPGGRFIMGSLDSYRSTKVKKNEQPKHQVIIQPFFMGKFTVTQEQYEAVMGTNPSHFPGKKRPVECVSWNNAVEFCAKLSKQTGKKYHLPSEAQWEYACRAGTTTLFHVGEGINTYLANYNGNSKYYVNKDNYRQETTNVGSFPANAFGLHDMHGNVWEWCEDEWHDNYVGAPSDGSSWISSNNPFTRVLRGGSWSSDEDSCHCAYRHTENGETDGSMIGFRVVCDVSLRT